MPSRGSSALMTGFLLSRFALYKTAFHSCTPRPQHRIHYNVYTLCDQRPAYRYAPILTLVHTHRRIAFPAPTRPDRVFSTHPGKSRLPRLLHNLWLVISLLLLQLRRFQPPCRTSLLPSESTSSPRTSPLTRDPASRPSVSYFSLAQKPARDRTGGGGKSRTRQSALFCQPLAR